MSADRATRRGRVRCGSRIDLSRLARRLLTLLCLASMARCTRCRSTASSRVLAVVFTCNHCPASQQYENRLRQIDEDYRNKGVTLVAINGDNPDAVPLSELAYSDGGDSLAEMKARAAHRRLQYPYLFDGDSQARVGEVRRRDHAAHLRVRRAAETQVRGANRRQRQRVAGQESRRAERHRRRACRCPGARRATSVVGCKRAILSNPSQRQQEMAKIEAEPVTVQMAGEAELKKLRANPTGKLLLVNFWATWCGPCVTEFPELVATHRMYRNRGFDFVSVSSNDPEEKPQVIEFLQKYHASGTNLQFATSDTFGLQEAFDRAMPAAVPFTVLIAPNGDVLFQQLGELDFLKLRRAILASLPDDAQHPGQQAYWSAH